MQLGASAAPADSYCRHRSTRYGGPVVGRFGLADISPVVGSTADGEHPARAVVGEHVPISATVFREGHDAVAANVVVRAPDGRRLPFLRMTSGHAGTRPMARRPRAGCRGHVDLHGRGVERSAVDVAPRGHRQDRGGSGRRGPRQRPRDRRADLRPARHVAAQARAPAGGRRRGRAARHDAGSSHTVWLRRSTRIS